MKGSKIMSVTLRIVLIIGVIVYFVIILLFLKHKALELKYTLLWMMAGIVLGIMVIWPETLIYFVRLLGIASNMNGLFIACIAFIMILMSLTSIVSRQADKIKNLTQTIAKMEKRLREVESNRSEMNSKHTGLSSSRELQDALKEKQHNAKQL